MMFAFPRQDLCRLTHETIATANILQITFAPNLDVLVFLSPILATVSPKFGVVLVWDSFYTAL